MGRQRDELLHAPPTTNRLDADEGRLSEASLVPCVPQLLEGCAVSTPSVRAAERRPLAPAPAVSEGRQGLGSSWRSLLKERDAGENTAYLPQA